jgi:hypothetical protein
MVLVLLMAFKCNKVTLYILVTGCDDTIMTLDYIQELGSTYTGCVVPTIKSFVIRWASSTTRIGLLEQVFDYFVKVLHFFHIEKYNNLW